MTGKCHTDLFHKAFSTCTVDVFIVLPLTKTKKASVNELRLTDADSGDTWIIDVDEVAVAFGEIVFGQRVPVSGKVRGA